MKRLLRAAQSLYVGFAEGQALPPTGLGSQGLGGGQVVVGALPCTAELTCHLTASDLSLLSWPKAPF